MDRTAGAPRPSPADRRARASRERVPLAGAPEMRGTPGPTRKAGEGPGEP